MDFSIFAAPETYVSLLTLILLEIVLGIDNIVFITILAGKMPREKQHHARRLGLAFALISRIALLAGISWVMHLKEELFVLFGNSFSGKDLILISGGLFLMAKATHEIYENVEHPQTLADDAKDEMGPTPLKGGNPMVRYIMQVMILDVVFSLDSVITAVGLVDHLSIMIIAVISAVGIMLVFAGPIGDFVQDHASVRVLALSFLVLIGFVLLFEGFEQSVSKGYVYFAMAFSLLTELLNMRMYKRSERKKAEAGEKAASQASVD